MPHHARRQGFTLVETMVAMAIVAILAALAYPSYRQYVVKSRRTQAQTVLLELMQKQERYYTYHNRYLAFSSASTDPDEKRFRWWLGDTAATSAYELRGEACPGQSIERCVSLVATPGTDKVDRHFRDAECQVLTLRSTGERAAGG
ncbi:MAG: type IV pilin protein, partial [Gammaproteobacteria bacterium]